MNFFYLNFIFLVLKNENNITGKLIVYALYGFFSLSFLNVNDIFMYFYWIFFNMPKSFLFINLKLSFFICIVIFFVYFIV